MLGAGTSANPWQVADYADLKKVGRGYDAGDDKTYALSEYYILTADIDASGSATENGSGDPVVYAGFVPIGTTAAPFTGSFNGDGHTIDDLMINRGTTTGIGLFGRLGAASVCQKLGLTNCDITGSREVGAFAGRIVNTLSYCYCTGSITGSNLEQGGITGVSQLGSAIDNCYSLCEVNGGTGRVGGLVGQLNGSATDCFSAGSVSTGSGDVGGLAGAGSGTATDCFWDTQTSGQATSGHGTGKTTAQMKDIDTYTDTATDGLTTAWDMTTEALHDGDMTTAVWFIDDGVDYPQLYFEYIAASAFSFLPIFRQRLNILARF